ncbi:SusC/RagA family TonB-linked outer membrane protein [Chitinophaga sp. XS-30]|uniref:SusC/RagA family TonB-linked outer membrane protein n=1 Tax=Chitinophaga sp. XS-30 TaxID=2604421 RepID=UPI00143E033E|nr:SusC/RagA family TonB-linked outer membrane protein [Chitinophaga sp. XS-30]
MRIQLVTFLILISCLNVFSRANAQKISLQVKQADLETVFRAIEKQTDYHFTYAVSVLAKSKAVTVELKNVSVTEALDHIFMELPYRYEILGRTILIKAKPVEQSGPEVNKAIIIRGKVTDKQNRPLEGVSVRIKGTSTGTLTDKDGSYSVEAEPNGVIIFSYVGYQTFEIRINGQTEINMTMVENTNQLEEQVIKGYYTTTKELNTGSISTVKAEVLAQQPVGDPLGALQGRVSGFYVQQSSGAPGRAFTVRLRGQNSLRRDANDPLYIIDGVPFNSAPMNSSNFVPGASAPASPLNDININDIESVEVLKDADATAIYGSRGANGVILITTKKGTAGKTSLTVNVYRGAGKVTRMMDLMNTEEYLAMRRKAFANDNLQPGVVDYDLNGTYDQTKNTNWQKELIGGTAHLTDIQASVGGGSAETQFRLSGGYRSETTVYPTDIPSRKGSGSFSLSHLSENKKLKLNFSGSYVVNLNRLPTSDLTQSILLAPNSPNVYLPDGNLNWANGSFQNPIKDIKQRYKELTNNFMVNSGFNYELLPGLLAGAKFGYSKNTMESSRAIPFISFNPTLSNPASRRSSTKANTNRSLWIVEPQISYRKELWVGTLDALIGTTFQSGMESRILSTGSGFSTDALIDNIAAATTKGIGEDTRTDYRFNSIYGRIGYNVNSKYVLNLTGRRDGSSRFGPRKKFGNFGAVGAAWIFSNERWVNSSFTWLSYGKLRGSYGIAGSDKLDDYKYMSTYSGITSNLTYQGISGITATQHTNPNYSWEAVKKLELAIELGLLDDKYQVSASWYRHRTNNQLVGYSLPDFTGFSVVQANLPATIQNRGLELELNMTPVEKRNFKWQVSTNVSFPKNKLVSYPGIETSSYADTYAVGYPLSMQYTYDYTGIDPQTKLYTFRDINKDGNITLDADRIPTFIGQRAFGGVSNSLSYRNWKLNIMVSFANQQALNFYFNTMPGAYLAGKSNQPRSVLNDPNLQPYSQSFSGEIFKGNRLFDQSNAKIGDASYVRLKNISLAWSIPKAWQNAISIKNASIYLQCQNLLTITKYKGLDPENPFSGALWLPPLSMTTLGISVNL